MLQNFFDPGLYSMIIGEQPGEGMARVYSKNGITRNSLRNPEQTIPHIEKETEAVIV